MLSVSDFSAAIKAKALELGFDACGIAPATNLPELEYFKEWVYQGRAWNEQYLLRAFLMNNRDYRIELFTAWLWNMKTELIRTKMPMCGRGGGGQIWLRKLM